MSFTELTDTQWKILEPLMPPPPPIWKCGRKTTPWRKVLNTIFWILTTGARWKDVPKGIQWASKSSAHRFLVQWQKNRTWENILNKLQETADQFGMINMEKIKMDGFFLEEKEEVRKCNMDLREKE